MNHQTNQPTFGKASRTAQPQLCRFTCTRTYRCGLITMNLIGLGLISMIVFALMPVAHAMSIPEQEYNQNSSVWVAVGVQQLAPTPMSTSAPEPNNMLVSTADLAPTPTNTPTNTPVIASQEEGPSVAPNLSLTPTTMPTAMPIVAPPAEGIAVVSVEVD